MKDLYIFQAKGTGHIKVGRSKQVEQRMKQVQVGCPTSLRCILKAPGLGHIERQVHRTMRMYRLRQYNGEWFRHEALSELPTHLYELLDLEDQDWWGEPSSPARLPGAM